MRRQEKEITDKKRIEEILTKSKICRLGLVDGDEAYIVPVNYAYHEGEIWIHSAPEGRKMELLRRSGKVSFEMELSNTIGRDAVPCRWTTRYRSAMGTGTVTIHDDEETKRQGMDLIMKRYGFRGKPRYGKKELAAMVILRLKVEKVTGKEG